MRNINMRFGTEAEYRKAIEQAGRIIVTTKSNKLRRDQIKYRFRLEKELFVLLNKESLG